MEWRGPSEEEYPHPSEIVCGTILDMGTMHWNVKHAFRKAPKKKL